MHLDRRDFVKGSLLTAATLALPGLPRATLAQEQPFPELPAGPTPAPVPTPHFPDPLHAFVWRNWSLVPVERLAAVLDATPQQILSLAQSMGLPAPTPVSDDQWRRSYLTLLRRNWHLLPYSQLLKLLDWTPTHLAFILREDDFLFIKLGSLKPRCEPLKYAPPTDAATRRAREIANTLRAEFPNGLPAPQDPLFSFVAELSAPLPQSPQPQSTPAGKPIRFCYSYFALYGDPLLEPEADPYPDGYLQRLAALGVTGVWLQGLLTKLAPFPWTSEPEAQRTTRLNNLRALARRCARHGIGLYLYLNEPRAMPLAFFEKHPDLRGVPLGDHAALCTSAPPVQQALTDAVAHLCTQVPELAGLFTITASENPTNCWSHNRGNQCPRCSKRSAADVLAEVNTLFYNGIQKAKSNARLIAWDWGWPDAVAPDVIAKLPAEVAFQSVSEWSLPITRGGVQTTVGEYSISSVGPGPRATRHWALARARGLRTLAKIQAGNTWELSATPYIPALENVATHVANLKRAGVHDLMLGWTLGGYPSPNLEVACAIASSPDTNEPTEQLVNRTLDQVAARRFGKTLASAVVAAWKTCSHAFSQFPYHGSLVYNAPLQLGPANLLHPTPTTYRATMVGFPYDDLDRWRAVYPPEVFIQQFTTVADGFDAAHKSLEAALTAAQKPSPEAGSEQSGTPRREDPDPAPTPTPAQSRALRRELDVIAAAALHFRSTANQARFVLLRNAVAKEVDPAKRRALADQLKTVLTSELALARTLHTLQSRDARLGFEASNQYYYVPHDLVEKILNCHHLLTTWLPALTPA